MSKEALEKLNAELVQHLTEKGVKDAYFYGPFCDEVYWKKSENAKSKKIAFCNIEMHDKNGEGKGIQRADRNIIGGWFDYKHSRTLKRIFIMNYLLVKAIENGETITKETVQTCDENLMHKYDHKLENDIFETFDRCSVYCNLRLTPNQTGKADEDFAGIYEFFSDDYYIDYYKQFFDALETDVLVVISEQGCKIINKVFPDFDKELKFNTDEVSKNKKLSAFSIMHPAGMQRNGLSADSMYEYFANKINFIKANI